MNTTRSFITILIACWFTSMQLSAQSDLNTIEETELDSIVKSKFKVTIGGQLKLNGNYDFNALQNYESFNVPSIPTGSNSDNSNRLSLGVRQSRLKLETLYNSPSIGLVSCYFEGDFFGQGTFNFRLRHFYVDLKSFRVGQSWSVFTDEDAWPDVIDFDGPPTGIWVRAAQIRYTKNFNNTKWAISLETPRPDIRQVAEIDSTLTETYQGFPDLATHINTSGNWGHAQLAFVYRKLHYKSSEKTLSSHAGGVALSGSLNIGKHDKIIAQGTIGKGIASYLVSFGGGGYDAIPDGTGDLQLLPIYGGYVAYEHWWAPTKLKSTFVYGLTHLEADVEKFSHRKSIARFYSGNLFWLLDDHITTGIEALYGDVEDFNRESGDAFRIEFMLLFNF
ncbi:DcaP family trimeric outer membrane transporter [Carboxylicivirga sp. RSCT41]|uniref:DcaP family trimeric outer membrane transporter n=1 Tax=Carboxylicivirga agarovorans TaxID=3417570 RepID=UPI003D32DFEB